MIRALIKWCCVFVFLTFLSSDLNRSYSYASNVISTALNTADKSSINNRVPLQVFLTLQATTQPNERSFLVTSLSEIAIKYDLNYWLEVSGTLGSADALFAKALQISNQRDRLVLLNKAANLGHAQSQFEIALNSPSQTKTRLFNESAKQGYLPAVIALGKLYYESGDLALAQKWLSQSASIDGLSAFKLAKLHWQQHEPEQALSLFEQSALLGYTKAKEYLTALNTFTQMEFVEWHQSAFIEPGNGQNSFNELPLTSLISRTRDQYAKCDQTIEVVATSLESLVQANLFINKFKQDERLKGLNICFNKPVWLSSDSFVCESGTKDNDRLVCDLTYLSSAKRVPMFSNLIIFEQEGKANVNNGIMYIDMADQYSVFVHELAHFAGFVDEYALPKHLAHYHCERAKAPNLILLGEISYSPMLQAKNWQEKLSELKMLDPSDERIGFSQSSTCIKAKMRAFKPSKAMTFMEFHDVEYIPRIYVELWQEVIEKQRNNKPILTNLAISAYENENAEMALYWENVQSQLAAMLAKR
ncbi:sel1 repeat family protein [Glaciecola sp. KUL10]|uniref:sel1 repeat family protein n=1 Tax=Glaciecola sp. (strain KUL10) TaxID=2161813 RepID=UPI000D782095|nr:sel1 repeat family protein [Glaciecola sp. KUL10]